MTVSHLHPESWAFFDFGLAMIIHACGDGAGMVEPFLDFGDIGPIVEGDGGGGGA